MVDVRLKAGRGEGNRVAQTSNCTSSCSFLLRETHIRGTVYEDGVRACRRMRRRCVCVCDVYVMCVWFASVSVCCPAHSTYNVRGVGGDEVSSRSQRSSHWRPWDRSVPHSKSRNEGRRKRLEHTNAMVVPIVVRVSFCVCMCIMCMLFLNKREDNEIGNYI